MPDTTLSPEISARFLDECLPDLCCPNCASVGMTAFYEVHGIPVHSCLLMSTRERALDFDTRDLRLGFCTACGFIGNTIFDPSVHSYSAEYEETQGFSGTFNAFAKNLAQRMVERYKLRDKTVLEIGCGKGEFLVSLCELGPCRGIGVDPAYLPQRTTSEAAQRIEFIRDFYGPRYAHLTADFVVCRHTLEHIAPTLDFLRSIRETIGDAADTVVFFELPETMRILREGAFWDIYYEHCSYFTPGSLARLFRSAGFELTELELDYADQYILIVARPVETPGPPALQLEDDLADVTAAISAFGSVCSAQLGKWHRCVEQAVAAGKRVAIWGSGSKGVSFLTTLGLGKRIEVVVDINPHKHGKFMPVTGQEIVPPAYLARYKPDLIIVMNPIYCDEIGRDLKEIGIEAELLPV